MKNFKIEKKLIVAFGITIALFLVMGTICIFGLTYSGNQFKDFYKYSYPMSNKTLEICKELQTSMKALSISILTNDTTETSNYIKEVENGITKIRENLNFLIDNYREDTSRPQNALDLLDKGKEY